MVCGRRFGPLHKFLKLAPEHIVHLQLAGDLFRDIQAVRAARVEIRFLQDQNVCICAGEEIYHALQLLAAVDVPVDNSQRTGRPDHPLYRCEVASNDFSHCHIDTVSGKTDWETDILHSG